jgi:hypothetical protein
MILVAGGDSFIWGVDLSDIQLTYVADGHSRHTFPALLAQQANMDYVCAAYPGNANNAISRMAIAALSKIADDKFLLVEWTYPQRREFRISDAWVNINSWHTTAPEFSKSYFKYAGDSEYYELYSILKEIVFLQQYCTINKIPYMFMTANNHFFQHENYVRRSDDQLTHLYSQINWENWSWFPQRIQDNETHAPIGFHQWAIENKYLVGTQGHPLEQAHADAAVLIKEKFNELVVKVS